MTKLLSTASGALEMILPDEIESNLGRPNATPKKGLETSRSGFGKALVNRMVYGTALGRRCHNHTRDGSQRSKTLEPN